MSHDKTEKFYCEKCHIEYFIDSGVCELATNDTLCYMCFHEQYPSAPVYYYDLLGADFERITKLSNLYNQKLYTPKTNLTTINVTKETSRETIKLPAPYNSTEILQRLSAYRSQFEKKSEKAIDDDQTEITPTAQAPSIVRKSAEKLRHAKMDHAWQNSRHIVLGRDNYRCIECGVSENLHVHHLIPRHLGGKDDPANLITLCAACHAVRHPTLQATLSRRFIERWAFRLARLFDYNGEIPKNTEQLALALRIMGKDRFLVGQLNVVLAALRGETILVVRPTGSGKTLCFQLPAILRPSTAFILSPLKALMADQIANLQRLKIPATFINSDLSQSEKAARYKLLDQSALKLLYVTPERFDATVVRDRDEILRLQRVRPSFLVIDEAHCVDRWGDDFRPSYGRISDLRTELGSPPTLAFTATAGLKAQRRILMAIGAPDARVIVSDVDRPNIALIRHETHSMAERYKITKKLIVTANGKVMLFVPTKKVGEEVRLALDKIGLIVPFYHSQLSSVDRDFLLGQFTGRIQPEIHAVICTNAFGMGIDIPNVRVVIHWVQPESVEDYLQEFGRAGRDGKPAIAIIFKSDNDTGVRRFMASKTLEQAEKRGLDGSASYRRKLESIEELDRMIQNRRVCFRKQIRDYFVAETPRRYSIAIRILECLLGSRQRVARATFCCDACDAKATQQLIRITTT